MICLANYVFNFVQINFFVKTKKKISIYESKMSSQIYLTKKSKASRFWIKFLLPGYSCGFPLCHRYCNSDGSRYPKSDFWYLGYTLIFSKPFKNILCTFFSFSAFWPVWCRKLIFKLHLQNPKPGSGICL